MLTAELAQWKQEDKSAALADLRAALRGKSEKSLATLATSSPNWRLRTQGKPDGRAQRAVLLDAVKRRAEPRAQRSISLPQACTRSAGPRVISSSPPNTRAAATPWFPPRN